MVRVPPPTRTQVHTPTTRAQAHTLEGVTAALILLSGLVFALQMTAVTPLSASTSNQFIENQQQASAEGMLVTARANGVLKRAILYWNDTGDRFHGTTDERPYYTDAGPPNAFGQMLNRTFGGEGVALNVHFAVMDRDGDIRRVEYIYRGEPSDNAVTATLLVTIHDDDPLYDENGTATAVNVTAADGLYMPDADPGSGVYNVVSVEVTVWRM